MEYTFEIYFDFVNTANLGFVEEKVSWGGEELSQDPIVFLSDNGLRFEEITDSGLFLQVTKEPLPKGYRGIYLRDQIINDLSLQINLKNDTIANPLVRFIESLNFDVDFVILLYRVDECITRKLYVNSNNEIITSVSEALIGEEPQDVMFINSK